MANNIYGTSGADSINGTPSDDDIWAYGGSDTVNPGAGEDRVYGGPGNDTYIVTDRWDLIYEAGGIDTALVYADFVKYAEGVEQWILQPGVKPLPYWIDALVTEESIYAQRWITPEVSFYYAFPKEPPSYLTSSDRTDWSALNDKQIVAVRTALTFIQSVTGLLFKETSDLMQPNVIAFANNQQDNSAGYSYYPDDAFWGSDLFFDNSRLNLDARTTTYFALTLMHELGHTLGLKHPFDDSSPGQKAVGPFLDIREENTKWTVMSYNEWPPYGLNMAPFDIAALQYLYGPNPTARAGDDRYVLTGGAAQFIWDGAGRDLIDGSSLMQPMHLSLEEGVWSWIGSKQALLISQEDQVTININTVIEDLRGGMGNDWLHGNQVANLLEGGPGNDTLTGGLGNDSLIGGEGLDWAVFETKRASANLIASVPSGAQTSMFSANTGSNVLFNWQVRIGSETDQLAGIERIAFSDLACALDVDGHGGEAYQALALLFGKSFLTPQNIGLALHLLDQGVRWDQLVGLACGSQVFLQQQGDSTPASIGAAVWKNLTGNPPDLSAKNVIAETQSQFSGDAASWLAWIADLPLVESISGLEPLRLTGITYAPWADWPGG